MTRIGMTMGRRRDKRFGVGYGRTLALVASLCVAGCGPSDSTHRSQDPEAVAAAPAPTFTLERDLTLAGAPDQPFGAVGAIATDAAGRIFVLDGMARTIHVFASDGSHLREIGGRGEGPGEFSLAVDLAISPDSLLWVTDALARQHLVFDLDGNVLRTVARRFTGGGQPGDRPFDAEGRYLDWALGFPNETATAYSDIVQHVPLTLRPGVESDGVAQWDSLPPVVFRPLRVEVDGMLRPMTFLSPSLRLTVDGRGHIWFADSSKYLVYGRTLEGDTVGRLRLDDEPAPTTAEDRAEVERFLGGRQPGFLAHLPDRKPLIRGLVADGAGRIFVLPETSSVRAGEAVDIFEEDGRHLGRLAFPEPLWMPALGRGVTMHATRHHLYIGGANAAAVPVLWRFRIVES